MKKFLILLLFLPLITVAQRIHLEKGDEYFRQHFYLEAISEYKLALEENVVINKFYMTQQVARTYRMLFDYENAELWYSKLIALGDENSPENYLHYAQLLANNGKYKDSEDMYAVYAQKAGKTDQVEQYRNMARWATMHGADSTVRMKIIKTNLQTGSRSMGIWLHDGYLYYAQPVSSDYTERTAFYDLSRARLLDSLQFGMPEKLGERLNKSFYEGTPWLSADGNTLLYTSNASQKTKFRNGKKNSKDGLSEEGLNVLQICMARKSNGAWGAPVVLNINSLDYSNAFPCMSPDGSTLYFASNMPNGHGGFDLYRASRINDSTFSAPVNLGPDINTFQDEMYPYLTDTALFYSTRGLPGYGGADVYRCTLRSGSLGKPVNMGLPFNSSKDDFSFILKPHQQGLIKGYLSSNREGTHGFDHVYHFTQKAAPVPPDTILARVVNRITGRPMRDVSVAMERYDREEVVDDTGGYTNEAGKMTLILKKNVAYRVTFRAEGFKPFVVEIPADDHYDAIARFGEIVMQPEAKKNTVIQIPNIYFDYDKATIRPESFPVLEEIVSYLNENPGIRVELSAHTDSRGSDAYNLKLSDKRAKSVVDYLIGKGIDRNRMLGKGYGETRLVNECKNGVQCSEEQHEMNRRVEMKVL
jgi:outer membrane protein OmpA-like peptidoglycan-associated protein/tetratricopeptide (TPR) repeat protein